MVERARSERLWGAGDRILVALSGGPDSVALLHVLMCLDAGEGPSLAAAHVNYGLRGGESDGDAEFCELLCKRLEVPSHIRRASTPPPGNLQDWARRLRYDFFEECRRDFGYTKVAVAHTADDRAETFLLQLFRGAGTFALGNVLASSGAVIRPFVGIRRIEVMAFLAQQRIAFRIDRSNFDPKYRRNRVRHELLPALDGIFEGDAVMAINEQADLFAADAAYLESQALELYALVQHDRREIRLAIEQLRRYHPSLQLRALRRMAADIGAAVGRETSLRLLELVAQAPGRRVELGRGVFAERGRDSVWFYKSHETPPSVRVECPGKTLLPDGSALTAKPANGAVVFPDGTCCARMALPEGASLTVRAAHAGDRMSPFGMKESRLVFDILADAGVPRHRREHVWVLTANDVIYWALGVRMAEHGRVRNTVPGIYEFTWCSDTN
jgi:tRNA(Ile)-lysidine synthase